MFPSWRIHKHSWYLKDSENNSLIESAVALIWGYLFVYLGQGLYLLITPDVPPPNLRMHKQ